MSAAEDQDGEDGAIEHIVRVALPWNQERLTQCGLPIDGLKRAPLSRDAFNAKLAKIGQQRTAMTTCMTCYQTIKNHPRTWDENPLEAMQREIASTRFYGGEVVRSVADGYTPHRSQAIDLSQQLRSIAVLIQRHRAEFDELNEDQRLTVPLPVGKRGRRKGG